MSAAPPAGYYLVWSDEFNGTSLNTTVWEYARNGWRNSAYNTSAAVSVSNGCLVITTYSAGGTNFTGFIDTYKTANPVLAGYGYYEASMQFSNAPGQWSAFWLQSPWMMNVQPDGTLGNTNNNATNGVEIDVFEHRCVDSNGSSWVNGGDNALHWNGYGSQEQSAVWSSQSIGVGSGFHTYGCLWTTNSYTFSVDGTVTWSTSKYLVSSVEQLIRLTSEVESNSWAGTVPAGGYPSLANSQVKMYVDYVRYYAPTNVHFWSGVSSPYWNQAGNWLSNLPPTATSDLTFSYFTLNNRTMSLGSDSSVDGLVFLAANGNSAFSINAGNTLTLGSGGIVMNGANYNVTLDNALNLAANQTWVVANNLTVNGSLSGSATLTKTGPGTLILNGSLAGPLVIKGGYLSGTGTVAGITTLQSGCELSPGAAIANAIGTLSFGGSLTLASGSTTLMEINAASHTNDLLNVAGALNCGGALSVANLAGTLAPGQSFRLFKAGACSGSFSSLTLPALSAGLVWNTNQLYAGVLSVIAVSPAETLALTDTGGGRMQLNWAYGTLQSATNVAGPYLAVSNASSPFMVLMTNSQMFYRVQEQ